MSRDYIDNPDEDAAFSLRSVADRLADVATMLRQLRDTMLVVLDDDQHAALVDVWRERDGDEAAR